MLLHPLNIYNSITTKKRQLVRTFAGHNKWSKIKRKKAVNDAARNKMYTKLLNQLAYALREVDGDQENAKFVQALQNAKAQGVPKTNIDNAIKRGLGESDGAVFEEVSYEGSGPNGSLFIIDCLTDNRKRTGPQIRKIFKDFEGSLGASGQAQWAFDMSIGKIDIEGLVSADNNTLQEIEEIIFEIAMDNGDVIDIIINDNVEDDNHNNNINNFCILCDFNDLNNISKAINNDLVKKNEGSSMNVGYVHIPKDENVIELSDDDNEIIEKLNEMISEFEDLDDVQNVFHNVGNL
jgi:YebC/PmpR family DNA-binding regulatory protein